MSVSDFKKTIERASAGMERAIVLSSKTDAVTSRADRVLERVEEQTGPARAARKREYERVMGDFGSRLARIGLAIGAVSIVTIAIGLVMPIGLFGFLAAVGLAIGVVGLMAFWPSRGAATPTMPTDVGNGEMVDQFDRYLYKTRRHLPPAAQAEVDAMHTMLPEVKKALVRTDRLDPKAQEARRLMSKHLPDLIERYAHVPPSFRDSIDGEGLTVDERLAEGLKAGRQALAELAEDLAKADMAAFETQGRFIQSRYGEKELDN